jgi:hypothetical protein
MTLHKIGAFISALTVAALPFGVSAQQISVCVYGGCGNPGVGYATYGQQYGQPMYGQRANSGYGQPMPMYQNYGRPQYSNQPMYQNYNAGDPYGYQQAVYGQNQGYAVPAGYYQGTPNYYQQNGARFQPQASGYVYPAQGLSYPPSTGTNPNCSYPYYSCPNLGYGVVRPYPWGDNTRCYWGADYGYNSCESDPHQYVYDPYSGEWY